MIAIINYSAGNTRSVQYALQRLGAESILTDDPAIIKQADKVIFPGVGEASSAMRVLRQKGLDLVIRGLTQPVLGICLGMQLLCESSEEGDTDCLGLIPAKVRRFPETVGFKIPHIGWNMVQPSAATSIFSGLQANPYFYFVHSYYVPVGDYTQAQTDYILPFSAALQHKNFYAAQFHPEKSGKLGERLLTNFLKMN